MEFSCPHGDAVEIEEAASPTSVSTVATIFVIDSDDGSRRLLEHCFPGPTRPRFEIRSSCTDVLLRPGRTRSGCVLIDPGFNGFAMLDKVCAILPVIVMTRSPTIAMAVRALQAGAVDFLEKPLCRERVLASIARARQAHRSSRFDARADEVDHGDDFGGLTTRQTQVLDLVMAGLSNKAIAANLGLSQRTVENHRAMIMRKFGCKSVARLVKTVCEKRRSGFHTA